VAKMPPIGYMEPDQILNLLGTLAEVFVLRNGVAYRLVRMGETQPGVWIAEMYDRRGKQHNEYMIRGDMWYVTRRDLINWPR